MKLIGKPRYSQCKSTTRESTGKPLWFESLDDLLLVLEGQKKIREVDRLFALFVAREYLQTAHQHDGHITVCMIAALLSEQLGQQQVCLPLDAIPTLFAPQFHFPQANVVEEILQQSPFVTSATAKATSVPLLTLDDNRLYLSRYWHYEQCVASKWQSLIAPEFPPKNIRQQLLRLYPDAHNPRLPDDDLDWQKIAITLACLKPSCVIAGGPGTGKTTTVVRILWMLSKLYQDSGQNRPIIRMVAPTGKAAARLSESVNKALHTLPDMDEAIPNECSTIHRLLGTIPGSTFFRHNQQRPLNLDVLVVDEASMIDLPLLAKMLTALPAHCRIILLGDSHQLASVEVGSVFSDICSLKTTSNVFSADTTQQLWQVLGKDGYAQLSESPGKAQCDKAFKDHIIYLKKSYRFDASKGIGQLASAINAGNVNDTFATIESPSSALCWHQHGTPEQLVRMVMPHFNRLHEAVEQNDVAGSFDILAECQILAIQKSGRWGVEAINNLVSKALIAEQRVARNREFYPGRPLMVTSNDHQNKLFNGDIGIVFAGNELGAENEPMLQVFFPDGAGGYRAFLPAQLPSHQTFYAMTTHKSQGSEFTNVILCMPDLQESNVALLNRELLYTAVTRSKEKFVLFASRESIHKSVVNLCKRSSGLAEILE